MVAIDDALDVSASPEQVWTILTEFNGYRQWNPFITHAKGTAKVGEQLELRLKALGDKEKILSAKISEIKEGKELKFVTSLIPGLLRWEHTLHVEDFKDSHVCIVQRAVFTGMMANRYKARLTEHLRSGFAAMNQALKDRVESGVPATSGTGYAR
jgi:hypothetical protein